MQSPATLENVVEDVEQALLGKTQDYGTTDRISTLAPASAIGQWWTTLTPQVRLLIVSGAVYLLAIPSELGYAMMMEEGALNSLEKVYEIFSTTTKHSKEFLELIAKIFAYGDMASCSTMIMNLPGFAAGIDACFSLYNSATAKEKTIISTTLALCSLAYIFGSMSPVIGFNKLTPLAWKTFCQVGGFLGQFVMYIGQAGSNPVKLAKMITKLREGVSLCNRFILPSLLLGVLSSAVRAGTFMYSGYELPESFQAGYSNLIPSVILTIAAAVPAFIMNFGVVSYNAINAAQTSETRYNLLKDKEKTPDEESEHRALIARRDRTHNEAKLDDNGDAVFDLSRLEVLEKKTRTPAEENEFKALSSKAEPFLKAFRLGLATQPATPAYFYNETDKTWKPDAHEPASLFARVVGTSLAGLSFGSRALAFTGFMYTMSSAEESPIITAGLLTLGTFAYLQMFQLMANMGSQGVDYTTKKVTGALSSASSLLFCKRKGESTNPQYRKLAP